MAKKKKNVDQTDENLVAVEEALSRTEKFIENNKNILIYAILGIAVVVLGIMGYQRYIALPNEIDAQESMFMAERYFEKDSFNLALQGDGKNMGFLQVMDEYGNTKSGNLAHYYAGICYLNLGNYDAAIDELKSFKSDDEVIKPTALGNIGNAYMEKGDMESAAEYYEKAANASDNDFTSSEYMLRLGISYEMLKNYDKALEVYKNIKKEYPNTFISQDIEKYIARAQAKIS